MSIKIAPIPTLSGLARAMDVSNTGIQLDAKYIGVGSGQQAIQIDSHGRAITDTLKSVVAWVEILGAEKIDETQTRMYIDMAGIKDTAWRFAECCLADENKDVIAIHGHSSQALMSVDPVIDTNILAINMVLGTLPADSINIIHQGVTLELLNAKDMVAMLRAVTKLSVSGMRDCQRRLKTEREQEVLEADQNKLISSQARELSVLRSQVQSMGNDSERINQLFALLSSQELFNGTAFRSIMGLEVAAMKHSRSI